jgi:tetratricopeptide (TPR) repeat protein
MKNSYQRTCVILAVIVFLVFENQIIAQKSGSINKLFFKNGLVAKEFYLGADQKTDSVKTYYKEGGLNEKFYYDDNSQFHGICEQFTSEGKLKTTWVFVHGNLIRTTHHIKEFNLKNKKTVDFNYDNIDKMDLILKANPNDKQAFYSRAASREYLQNDVLAEIDYLILKADLENIKASSVIKDKVQLENFNKTLSEVYSRLGSIYSDWNYVNIAVDYKLKAINADPNEIRFIYNLGSYLVTEEEDFRLGIYFLNEVTKAFPNHNFAHWVLGYSYLELEQYDKAIKNIDIAFENEANLYEYGYGTAESDLRTIRGLAYHKSGKTDLGIKDLNEALRINDKNSVANKYLGIIYDDLGQSQKACEYFQKARTLGYEKKYYNKELQSFIQKNCTAAEKIIATSYKATKDLPYIAPNPADNEVEVFNFPFSNFNYEILNPQYQKLRQGISNDKIIETSGLPSGFYILMVSNGDKREIFKLIKK